MNHHQSQVKLSAPQLWLLQKYIDDIDMQLYSTGQTRHAHKSLLHKHYSLHLRAMKKCQQQQKQKLNVKKQAQLGVINHRQITMIRCITEHNIQGH